VKTDTLGIASLATWKLGGSLGANTLTATALGTALSPASLTATGITPGSPFVIAGTTSNVVTQDAGFTLTTKPAAIVRDIEGNPISGLTLAVSHTGTARGLGSAFFSTSGAGSTEMTNSEGVATVNFVRIDTALMGTPRITPLVDTVMFALGSLAPMRFFYTNRAGPASRTAFISNPPAAVSPGASLGSLQVEIQDQYGNKVTTATNTVGLLLTGGSGSLSGPLSATAVAGVATFTGNSVATLAASYRLTATGLTTSGQSSTFAISSGTATGVPVVLSIVQGNNQTAAAGTVVPIAPRIRIGDGENNPVAGVTVTFTSSAPGTSVTGSSGGSPTAGTPVVSRTWVVTTDASGFATVPDWQLGSTPGANLLIATMPGPISITFSAVGS
jgi:mRNA-degrading endonuclease toxin of MazEF toxin-antitoxin module